MAATVVYKQPIFFSAEYRFASLLSFHSNKIMVIDRMLISVFVQESAKRPLLSKLS